MTDARDAETFLKCDVKEFIRFHKLLLKNAPVGYKPFYFRCAKNGKEPYTKVGPWLKNGLTPKEAVEWLKEGWNIGIAALNQDPLVLIDIDDESVTDYKTLKSTLTARSGGRKGVHLYYFQDIVGSIPNIPTDDAGEIRADNQYVIAPGSYVEGYKDKIENIGRYTIEAAEPCAKIAPYDIPPVFLDQLEKNKEDRKKAKERKAKKKHGEAKEIDKGKSSAFFDLTVFDIIGSVENPQERFPSIFHGSDTGKNTSISNQGLIQCWRHTVSLNAQQALCVLSGKLSCQEAGSPHAGGGAGVGLYADNDEALLAAWKYAKENGLIPEDDPIPTRAMCHIAINQKFCKEEDIKDGWEFPGGVYKKVLDYLEKEKINPGRKFVEAKKKEEKKEFDYETWKNELFTNKEDMREIKSVIDYVEGLGIVYLYTDTNTQMEGLKIKPFISVSRINPVFPVGLIVNGVVPEEKGVRGTFPEERFVYGVRELFLQPNTVREMHHLLLRILEEPLSPWKDILEVKKKLVHSCKSYLDYREKNYNLLIVIWTLMTYLTPIFTYFPILTFFGLRNTAKSTAIDWILKWGFNSGGNVIYGTKSGFFRGASASKGVQPIDHFEKVKRDSERYTWLSNFFEGCWNRNTVVEVSEKKGDTFVSVHLSVFCPCVVGTRTLIDVIEEKGIVIETEETDNTDFKKRCDKMDYDPDFQTFIRYGLEFGLLYGSKIKEFYLNFNDKDLDSIDSRAYNLIKPLLSVAKFICDEEEYKSFKSFLLELMKKRREEKEDREEILLLYLAKHEEYEKITLSDLTNVMRELLHYPDLHYNAIKGDMRKLKISKDVTRNPITYRIDREAVEAKIKRRGLEKKLEEWKEGDKEEGEDSNPSTLSGGTCEKCGEEATFLFYQNGRGICGGCRGVG